MRFAVESLFNDGRSKSRDEVLGGATTEEAGLGLSVRPTARGSGITIVSR